MMRSNIFFVFITLFLNVSHIKCGQQYYDLTWDFEVNKTVYWPNVQPFVFTKQVASNSRGFWYSANEFCTGEHGGTHLDAPYHFNKNGLKVSDIPIERLIAKGVLIDLSNDTLIYGSNNTLNVSHLEKWEKENGLFDIGTVLLIKFNWGQYWNDSSKYLGVDDNGNLNFPGISEEAATWIVNQNKFFGVGVDTPSVDPGYSTDYAVHKILAKHQIYGLENVKLVEDIEASFFNLDVLPMKLKEGTGAPVRIILTACDKFVKN